MSTPSERWSSEIKRLLHRAGWEAGGGDHGFLDDIAQICFPATCTTTSRPPAAGRGLAVPAQHSHHRRRRDLWPRAQPSINMALQRHRNVLTVAAGHRHPPSYHGLGAAAVSGRAVACAPVSITVANPRDWQRLSGLSIVGVRIRAMLFGSVRTRTAAGSSGHRLTLYTQVRVLLWWPVSAEQGRADSTLG